MHIHIYNKRIFCIQTDQSIRQNHTTASMNMMSQFYEYNPQNNVQQKESLLHVCIVCILLNMFLCDNDVSILHCSFTLAS